MKAMILAAGRGGRMRAHSEDLPKPLVQVNGRSLIEYRVIALVAAGMTDIVINLHYHPEKIQQVLGDGSAYGAQIFYSVEAIKLETGGGIKHALPLLGDKPFVVTSADIYTDFDYSKLAITPGKLAHLVVVDNPGHNPKGDFQLNDDLLSCAGDSKQTYSGIAIIDPALVKDNPKIIFPVVTSLIDAMKQGLVTGENFSGQWVNVDTPERLALAKSLA